MANMAIIEVVKRGDASAVDALLTDDPTLVFAVDEHAKTPLHWAVECDHHLADLLTDAAGSS